MQREDEENDLSSSDSDQSMISDDEDESIEDDVVLEPIDDEEYRQLRSQVDLNPSDYPARQAYIHAEERKHGRASPPSIQARQEAHQAYPQPEPFWLDWITAVAATLPQSTREESQSRLQAIHSLVQQCQSDYQSISVWMRYIEQMTLAYKKGNVEIADVREAYEEALQAGAYHYQEAERIWSSYRDFELKIADSLDSLRQGGMISEDVYAQQQTRIRQLFERELGICSAGSQDAYDDYRSWESMQGRPLPDAMKKQWTARKHWLKQRDQWESQIEATPDALTCYQSPPWDLLPSWIGYLDWECAKQEEKQSNLHPTWGLFERAVVAFALSVDIWSKFCHFAIEYREAMGVPAVLQITQRAIRNCSWSGTLWSLHLLMTELAAPEQYEQVWERALQAPIQDPAELALLYQAHIDYQWRRVGYFHAPSTAEASPTLWNAFRAALSQAKSYFGDKQFAEQHQQFLIEGLKYDALIQQQNIAESVAQKVAAKYPLYEETWLAVIETHLVTPLTPPLADHVSLPTVRSWYQQGLRSVSQWPARLSQEWKWFERIYGDVSTYLDAYLTILRKHTQLMALYQTTSSATPSAPAKERKAPRASRKKDAPLPKAKRARSQSSTEEGPQKKRQKKQREPKEEVLPAETKNEPNEEVPQSVIHVSNLPWKKEDQSPMDLETLEGQLRQLFEPCGDIQDIRVIKDSQNKLTGFAFLEFANPSSASQALQMDSPQVGGRTLRVELSKSSKEEEKLAHVAAQKPSVSVPEGGFSDHNTVFASNLPFKATDAEIKQLFKKCRVKEIRLKRNSKNGFLLGYGYIEMEDAESVETALTLDKKSFKGRTINVAKSEPKQKKKKKERLPEERPAAQSTKDSDSVPSTLRTMKKGNLFAPRALMKKVAAPSPASDNGKEESSGTNPPPKPKSNDDFRKMFLK